jgi:phosphoenolpyruvate carboxykinase (GTP)
LWPGFGENLRVLEWIIGRVEGKVAARDTPIGLLPDANSLDLTGLELSAEARSKLFHFDALEWHSEFEGIAGYLAEYGDSAPATLCEQVSRISTDLQA